MVPNMRERRWVRRVRRSCLACGRWSGSVAEVSGSHPCPSDWGGCVAGSDGSDAGFVMRLV